MNIPPDRMYYRKVDMENDIRIALGGRVSEDIVFGKDNITTGASNDIERATEILLNMVRRFGMNSKSGLLNYDVLYNSGFRNVQDEVMDECKESMERYYSEVKELLENNHHILEAIANELLEKETLDQEELDQIISGNNASKLVNFS